MQAAKIWRWLALFAVLVNVGFNYIYVSDGTMTQVTDTYRTAFRPAGYAFSIWGVIYLSWIAFCIYELLPHQLKIPSLESLSRPVILSSILSICWIIAFTSNNIIPSMVLIVAMLGVALWLLKNANDVVKGSTVNKWLVLVPFSLYAGWLSVATIANSFILVSYMGWEGTMAEEQVWAIGLVIVAGVAGAEQALRYRNPFFPLVIAWASLALWVEQGSAFETFGTVCLIVAAVMVLLGIFDFTRRWPERREVL